MYNAVVSNLRIKKQAGIFKASAANIIGGLNHLLWPAVCMNCNVSTGEENGGLCSSCWQDIASQSAPEYCRRCGRQVAEYGKIDGACAACAQETIHFDGIARSGIYDGILRRMILSFKNGSTQFDKILALLLNAALEGSAFASQIEYFEPVPLHWMRRLNRGFNQSYLLAKHIKVKQKRIDTDLVRIRRTKRQAMMASPAQRARNVAGAFSVRPNNGLRGRTICLVDDIKTTGATLNECARVLKNAGAEKVYALVVAVAAQAHK